MRPEFCSLMATEGLAEARRIADLEAVDSALDATRLNGALWPALDKAVTARMEEAIAAEARWGERATSSDKA